MAPFYEYLCEMGHEFELEENITAEPRTTCCMNVGETDDPMTFCVASCKRQISKTSFKLKGGGWSQDGYARKGN